MGHPVRASFFESCCGLKKVNLKKHVFRKFKPISNIIFRNLIKNSVQKISLISTLDAISNEIVPRMLMVNVDRCVKRSQILFKLEKHSVLIPLGTFTKTYEKRYII